jgi:hypothetical protein
MSVADTAIFDAGHTSEMGASININSIPENKEDITLIWFAPDSSTNDDIGKITEELRVINNFIHFPTDIDSCITDIKRIKEEKICLIISNNNAFKLLPSIIKLPQLDSVFIFPENGEELSRLRTVDNDYHKIVDGFDNSNDLIKSIREQVKHINRQLEMVLFYNQHQQGTRDLSEQSPQFLWYY